MNLLYFQFLLAGGIGRGRADEYLRRAQQCLEMARKFREQKSRATLTHMAEVWLRLAQRLQQQQQTQPKNDKE